MEAEQAKNEHDAAAAGGKTKESKDERKARMAQLEKDIDAQVLKEKSSFDFTSLTRESSRNADGMTVLDALAASGLRSLRYWKEVPGVRTVAVP